MNTLSTIRGRIRLIGDKCTDQALERSLESDQEVLINVLVQQRTNDILAIEEVQVKRDLIFKTAFIVLHVGIIVARIITSGAI